MAIAVRRPARQELTIRRRFMACRIDETPEMMDQVVTRLSHGRGLRRALGMLVPIICPLTGKMGHKFLADAELLRITGRCENCEFALPMAVQRGKCVDNPDQEVADFGEHP
jgi:hypothetical protein